MKIEIDGDDVLVGESPVQQGPVGVVVESRGVLVDDGPFVPTAWGSPRAGFDGLTGTAPWAMTGPDFSPREGFGRNEA